MTFLSRGTSIGTELFSLLTCLVTTTFTLLRIFPPLEMIWEALLSWHAVLYTCIHFWSLSAAQKHCMLKLPIFDIIHRTNSGKVVDFISYKSAQWKIQSCNNSGGIFVIE